MRNGETAVAEARRRESCVNSVWSSSSSAQTTRTLVLWLQWWRANLWPPGRTAFEGTVPDAGLIVVIGGDEAGDEADGARQRGAAAS